MNLNVRVTANGWVKMQHHSFTKVNWKESNELVSELRTKSQFPLVSNKISVRNYPKKVEIVTKISLNLRILRAIKFWSPIVECSNLNYYPIALATKTRAATSITTTTVLIMLFRCFFCGISGPELKRCSNCKLVMFCSDEHKNFHRFAKTDETKNENHQEEVRGRP